MLEKRFIIVVSFILVLAIFSTNRDFSFSEDKSNLIVVQSKQSIERSWDSISLIYPDQYHNFEQLTEELELINSTAPEILEMSVIGNSIQGRNITLVKITNEEDSRQKANAFFVTQHHAREQITVEAILRFMHEIINGYGTNERITDLVDNLDIYIIPTLNPDGLHYVVEEGNEWLRKNLHSYDDDGDGLFDEDPIEDVDEDGHISEYYMLEKLEGGETELLYSYIEGIDNDGDGLVNEDPIGGVDLNRNYDYRWNDSTLDSGSTSDTTSDVYPGESPFSEPETQAYIKFIEDKSFATVMSLHSGINTTYFPYGSTGYWANNMLYYQIYNDFKDLLPDYFFFDYLGLPETEPSLHVQETYTTAGDWGDYMYANESCMVPLTFEIFHTKGSEDDEIIFENDTHIILEWDGMYDYFAPQESHIDSLWDDIRETFYYWLELTPQIQLNSYSYQGNLTKGSTIKIELAVSNPSPLLDTIEQVHIINTTINLGKINEDSSKTFSFDYTLNDDVESLADLNLLVGNEYIGYISIGETSQTETTSIGETSQPVQNNTSGLGIGFTICSVIILLFFRKKKRR